MSFLIRQLALSKSPLAFSGISSKIVLKTIGLLVVGSTCYSMLSMNLIRLASSNLILKQSELIEVKSLNYRKSKYNSEEEICRAFIINQDSPASLSCPDQITLSIILQCFEKTVLISDQTNSVKALSSCCVSSNFSIATESLKSRMIIISLSSPSILTLCFLTLINYFCSLLYLLVLGSSGPDKLLIS